MAKVTVSIPDDLLARIDSQARRQGTSRGSLLRKAARHEVGGGPAGRDEMIDRLEEVSRRLVPPADAPAITRRGRDRSAVKKPLRRSGRR